MTRTVLQVRLARSAAVTAAALVGAIAASVGGIAPIRVGGPGSSFLGWALVAPEGAPLALGQDPAVPVPADQPVATKPDTARPPTAPSTDEGATSPSATGSGTASGGSGGGTGSGSTGGSGGSGGTQRPPADTGTPPETIYPTDGYPVTVTLTRHPWPRPIAPTSTEPVSSGHDQDPGTHRPSGGDCTVTYAVWVTRKPVTHRSATTPSHRTAVVSHHTASAHPASSTQRQRTAEHRDRSPQRGYQPKHVERV